MSIKLKSSFFTKNLLPNTLIVSLIIGALISLSPPIRSSFEVEADIIDNHLNNNTDLNIESDNPFSFFHENTIYPQSALKIEPKINAIIVESNIKEEKDISENFEVLEIINTTITGYSSTIDQTDSQPFITASGSWVKDGIVATNFLPFGTKIRIPEFFGDKIFIVKDRMNQRHTDRVDIWFSSRQQALNLGIKYTYIETVQGI